MGSFQNYVEIGSRQMSLSRVETDGAGAHRLARLLRYTQMATFRRRDYVTLGRTFHINIAAAIMFLARASQIQSLIRLSVALAVFTAWTRPAMADQQQRPFSFQVPKNDSAAAEALADQLAALSPRVNRDEAKLLAECAYATVSKLRRDYRMFGTPIFNNFLIYHGLRKRGYCYQWSEDLLVALDKLKLTSLELHWGEYDPRTWRENNCIVVTAKGQPFQRGIMLECWRHLGHLYYGPVAGDYEHYVENSAYARLVRNKAASSKVSEHNHRVAFQRSVIAKGKAGD